MQDSLIHHLNTMTTWVIFWNVWLIRIFVRDEIYLPHCRKLQCQQVQIQFRSVVSRAGFFATPWTAASQGSLKKKYIYIYIVIKNTTFFFKIIQICVVVQFLSHVWLFATPWTATRQASLSFSISWSLLKLVFIGLVMPSNHLIFCRLLLLLPSH